MSRKFALTLAAAALVAGNVFAAGNAFADDITVDTTPFVSTKTRAQVQAELAGYQRVNPWPVSYGYDFPAADFRSTLTRAQVKAELAEFRRTHPYPIPDELFGDYSGEATGAAQVAGQPVNGQ